MSKESFKVFARNNPELIDYVKNKRATWQELYEVYNLYGEDRNIWNKYLSSSKDTNSNVGFKDIVDMVKDIDLEKVRSGIDSIQKTISMVQDLGLKTKNENRYQTRYRYRHLDD